MPQAVRGRKRGRCKVNPNRIIPIFFDLNTWKPHWEFLPNNEQIINLAGYKLPKHPDSALVFKSQARTVINQIGKWLCDEYGFNYLSVKMEEDKRVHHGFSRKIEHQKNNLLRVEKRKQAAIKMAEAKEGLTDSKIIDMVKRDIATS
jgi:hypothetical protein